MNKLWFGRHNHSLLTNDKKTIAYSPSKMVDIVGA